MRDALRESTVARIVRHSRVARLYAALRRRIDRLGGSGDDATAPAARTSGASSDADLTAGSLLVGRLGGISGWIEGSWLYRWLTAEPEPEVIVIDLRETRLVGPVLAVLDWLIAGLTAKGAHSLLAAAGYRGYRLAVVQPLRLVALLLGGVAVPLAAVGASAGSAPLVAVAAALAVCAVLGSRLRWSWAELRKTRLVRLLAAAFEPPEPPDDSTETSGRDRSERDDR